MEIKSENFEEKIVTDVSARYDNSTVDFTLQEVDELREETDQFVVVFSNPGKLRSSIRLFKQGLRAISFHDRTQRYRLDLPDITSPAAPVSPSDPTPPKDPSVSSTTLAPSPQA